MINGAIALLYDPETGSGHYLPIRVPKVLSPSPALVHENPPGKNPSGIMTTPNISGLIRMAGGRGKDRVAATAAGKGILETINPTLQTQLMSNSTSKGHLSEPCCSCTCRPSSLGCGAKCPCRLRHEDCTHCRPGDAACCTNHAQAEWGKPHVTTWTDGAASNNQALDLKERKAGIGVLLRSMGSKDIEISEPFDATLILWDEPNGGITNQRAEILAAARAIEETPPNANLEIWTPGTSFLELSACTIETQI